MEFWNSIYSQFDPVALDMGLVKIHWYSLMYILALLSSLWIAKWIVAKDSYPLNKDELDSYFFYAEIGVILGARIGYILFYDPHTNYYLTHPWQIFNPFMDGEFVGIRGMSYHGAIIGFLIATYLYSRKYSKNLWIILDLVAISAPLGYTFGRIGNFLNQELFGRETDLPIGIYVDGVLRHPSQLYEAFLEGIVLFIIIYLYRTKKRFNGELIAIYGFAYGVARFIAEFFREPDFHLGFIYLHLSMGQLLSLLMIAVASILYLYLKSKANGEVKVKP